MSDEHENSAGKRRSGWLGKLMLFVIIVMAFPFLIVVFYRVMPPPISTLMILRSVQGQKIQYQWRSYDQLSKRLVQAVTISEDAGICKHPVRICNRVNRGKTCHHVRQRSAHNKALFLANNGNLNAWHQLLCEHSCGASHATHSNDHQMLSLLLLPVDHRCSSRGP